MLKPKLEAATRAGFEANMYVIEVVGGSRAAVFHTFPAASRHPDFLLPDYIFHIQILAVTNCPVGNDVSQSA